MARNLPDATHPVGGELVRAADDFEAIREAIHRIRNSARYAELETAEPKPPPWPPAKRLFEKLEEAE